MDKKLVAYFSASGVTRGVAEALAEAAGADLYEIKPEIPYTAADLNWNDRKSRSTLEMRDPDSRPKILEKYDKMNEYSVIFLGFPIWWYTAPAIIKTFLESYDLSGKKIILFATSGGSGLGKTDKELQAICPGAYIQNGRMFSGKLSQKELLDWADSI
ncbi:NAD(P)H-dependent oxidoreductase [Mogibacterium sp. NSJ-24]|jgi:flavodoxin|uniref:NAD(P)H-dependent oxidoreductase n=1 Tax=Lentihominibacter hominis TaxID=2763645 RepID=A0A926EA50_9FIRM|nr:flavodoxin [Lentihominibacter hominis]MBC8568539.1 NAD(P)H-dependent oxidoreductase [Lentihominibacter hominis]